MEEEALDTCDRSGALDRFVLQWRALARRIEHASGTNTGLRRARETRALALARSDWSAHPEGWSAARRAYVEALFGGKPWRG
jgi:hypothetical protein